MKLTYRDIPQMIEVGNYEINVPLQFLLDKIKDWQTEEYYSLQLNPDFQRGHVWTKEQQTAFIEYFIQGGRSGMVVYFNKPSWQGSEGPDGYDDFVCVDGLQRLTALMGFLQDEVPAFGQVCSEFGPIRMMRSNDNLKMNINNLKTKAHVLAWYLQMNAGGTPHTAEEINKVRLMLEKEKQSFEPVTP